MNIRELIIKDANDRYMPKNREATPYDRKIVHAYIVGALSWLNKKPQEPPRLGDYDIENFTQESVRAIVKEAYDRGIRHGKQIAPK